MDRSRSSSVMLLSLSELVALLDLFRKDFLRVRLGVLGWAVGSGLADLSSSSVSVPGISHGKVSVSRLRPQMG